MDAGKKYYQVDVNKFANHCVSLAEVELSIVANKVTSTSFLFVMLRDLKTVAHQTANADILFQDM